MKSAGLYKKTAKNIIKNSIKSAVFIDENALEFYQQPAKKLNPEQRLSKQLHKKFKENGVSLTVHRFLPADIANKNIKKYLFDDRDLVLLDWELDNDYAVGKRYSLDLLADIISSSHLHFCAIYTSTPNVNDVFDNIISFFSNKSQNDFDEIKNELSAYENDLLPVLKNVNIYDFDQNKRLIPRLAAISNTLLGEIKEITKVKDIPQAVTFVKMAFEGTFLKSDKANPKPDLVDRNNSVLVINNTIITLIKKDLKNDSHNLINKLSTQITKSQNSFTQLLGVEMQSIFKQKASFIDPSLLNVSINTLLYHRTQILKDGSDLPFEEFMKNLLLENASLKLRGEKLSILDSIFLNSISPKKPKTNNTEIAKINTFYNGSVLDEARLINFGDIFHFDNDTYYMCITPLCDCLYPDDNIKNRYFFVKGISFGNVKEAISLGDEAFISYLDERTCISWAGISKGSDLDKHKPIYVKPIQIFITDSRIIDSKIYPHELTTEGYSCGFKLTYRFTLRQQYAQRIANHAFSHPIRVGVDFVKS